MYWLVHELGSQNNLGSQARVFSWTDRCVWAREDKIKTYQAKTYKSVFIVLLLLRWCVSVVLHTLHYVFRRRPQYQKKCQKRRSFAKAYAFKVVSCVCSFPARQSLKTTQHIGRKSNQL